MPIKHLSQAFTPTSNRRLNELIGFVLCIFALLLFLALASYSPLDPSLNSASVLTSAHAARNWIGVVGAFFADLILQCFGIGGFLLPVFALALGFRWFRSRRIGSPLAKFLGASWMLMFFPALLALLPGHLRWMGVIPIEGLLGRIVGDFLVHYFNPAGANIVCFSVLAVALYLSTAFSFAALQVWAPTRFAFAIALWDRWKDWQEQRAKKRMQRELEKRRAAPKPVITTQMVPARAAAPPPPAEPVRTGIDRTFPEEPQPAETQPAQPVVPEVSERADSAQKPKTTLPRMAGGFKLPPSSLLQRPDEQQAVDAGEL
ncbi:MAG TPA: DNA translocase FtsK 4TM domain-containing protein, partial [Terriglobales bacterium]|nr:DNA translocase FtsK 4TM domain-containing protein [Terriglobales bacterium]